MRIPLCLLLTFVIGNWPAGAEAQTRPQTHLEDLKRLSIEELAETDVTGSGRRSEQLEEIALGVSVITADDLRRYGVMTLPDALRLADAIHVARVTGPGYAISSRGFNITTANKMLVMIDGRTVYSPVFAGVFWEAQDLMIADIDRIEIVRGPGGTLWGANAVNGVIHVITKDAAVTHGTFVNAAIGSETVGPFAVRHGGRFAAAGSYRVYAKVRHQDDPELLSGGPAGTEHTFGQAGFRIESDRGSRNFVMLQGDAFHGTTGLGIGDDRSIAWRGGNLLARWIRRSAGAGETTVQAYYDYFSRRVPQQYRGLLHTVDLDVQHQRNFAGRHVAVVGGGYRHYRGDDLGDGPGFFFDPQQRVSHRSNVFAQAQFGVTGTLFLTLGTKVEFNEFTGAEVQPTIALRWTRGNQTVWGYVSKAVRVPSRIDTDLRIRVPNTSTIALTGTDTFKSEELIAYEAGYRRRIGNRLSLDVNVFDNHYDELRSQESSPPIPPGIPVRLMNMLNGVTRGLEFTSRVQAASWWQLEGGYSHLWKRFTFDPGSTDHTGGRSEANDPRHIFKLRSYVDAGSRFEIDAFFRYIGALPAPAVEAYAELDARVGYHLRPGWDLSLIGTDLLHKHHLEFRGSAPPQVYQRAVTLRSTWRF